MRNFAQQEDLEIKESLNAEDVSFEHYFRHIVQLDKSRYNQIFDDPKMRSQFSQMSIEERLSQFSSEFQAEVRALYQNQINYKKAHHAVAANVYRIGILTGATYKEIAQTLEAAFSKQLSKAHICKLYKTGQLLSEVPQLSVIQDVEKLATLSRVPTAKLQQMIATTDEGVVRVANLDIGKASRAQVSDLVKQEIRHRLELRLPSLSHKYRLGTFLL